MKYFVFLNMAAKSTWYIFTSLSRFGLVVMRSRQTTKSHSLYNFTNKLLIDRSERFGGPFGIINQTKNLLSLEQRRFAHGLKGGQAKQSKEFRSNQNIKAKNVRLIDQEGKNLGIVSLDCALDAGKRANCVVVEVGSSRGSSSGPETICKLISEQQLYAKMKEEKKKHTKTSKTKEIKVTGKISEHDLDIKLKKIREFLEGHNSVKVFVAHRRRQNTSLDDKKAVLDNIAEQISDLGCLQGEPKTVGNGLRGMFIPHQHK